MRTPRAPSAGGRTADTGFTLLEVMVSVGILSMILFAVFGLLNITSRTYRQTTTKVDALESGRAAFDALGRGLRQAVLNSYYGYDDPAAPQAYKLKSHLHFVCGRRDQLGIGGNGTNASHAVFFQAPLGMADGVELQSSNLLLNSLGYYLEFGDDPLRPGVLDDKVPRKNRYRLFQYQAPRENMKVYEHTVKTESDVLISAEDFDGFDWFRGDILTGRNRHLLADNVVALAILPVAAGGEAGDFLWNSRDGTSEASHHKLPAALKVVMAVIDESSAEHLGASAGALPENLFTDPDAFDDDVQRLEDHFVGMSPPVEVRVFQTEIPLQPANPNL